jgi:hypothetical protein
MIESLGIICVVASWIAGAFMLTKWRGTRDMSISLHAASARAAYIIFALVLTLGGGLFMVYLYGYFIPTLKLGNDFRILLALAFACQVVAAWVPDIADWNHWRAKVHKVAAWSMAVLFMPLTGLILLSPELSSLARIIGNVCFISMVVLWAIFIFGKGKTRFLVYQTLYIVMFQITILAAGYLS